METLRNPGINFPVSGLAAIIVTGMLLWFIVTLSKIYIPTQIIDRPEPVFIPDAEPPDPIKTEETEVFTQEPIAPINRDATPDRTSRPDTITPVPLGNISGPGDVELVNFTPGKNVKIPYIPNFFTLDQVEHKPRILRPVTPMYPYQATIKGIEGRVVMRFIIDENGEVINPEVVTAKPEGVFEEAALEAIVKYKFIPAKIGSKKVKCIAVMPIGFKIK